MPVLQSGRVCESDFSVPFHSARGCDSSLDGLHSARVCETELTGELHSAKACESTLWQQSFADYWINVQAATATWASGTSNTDRTSELNIRVVGPIPSREFTTDGPILSLNRVEVNYIPDNGATFSGSTVTISFDPSPGDIVSIYYNQGGSGSSTGTKSGTKLNIPNPIPTLLFNGTDVFADLAQEITIDEYWNGVSQLSVAIIPPHTNGIVDLPSNIIPPGYGPFAGQIKRHQFDVSAVFQVLCEVAQEAWMSPSYLPTEPEIDENGILRWGGQDLTGLLLQEHQQMDSIQLEAGQHVMSWDAYKEICTQYGILNVRLNFYNYLLRELHRSGDQPRKWLGNISEPMQGAVHFEGNLLVCETFRPGDSNSWEFVDRQNIWKLHGPVQLPRPKNSFTFARLEPAGNILVQAELTGPECLVRQKVTLDKPARFVQVEVQKVVNGQLTHWSFFDKDDNVVVTAADSIAVSNVPIVRFEFDYIPQISNNKWTPHYEVLARGTSITPGFSQGFAETWPPLGVLSPTQAFDGIYPEFIVQESATVADADTALLAAKAAEAESVRKYWGITLRTPYLNPFVRAGQRILVKDFLTRQDGVSWFIDHIQKKWNRGAGTWEMVLECSRGV